MQDHVCISSQAVGDQVPPGHGDLGVRAHVRERDLHGELRGRQASWRRRGQLQICASRHGEAETLLPHQQSSTGTGVRQHEGRARTVARSADQAREKLCGHRLVGPGGPRQLPGHRYRRRKGGGQERRVPYCGGPRQVTGAAGGGQEGTVHALAARHQGWQQPGGPHSSGI